MWAANHCERIGAGERGRPRVVGNNSIKLNRRRIGNRTSPEGRVRNKVARIVLGIELGNIDAIRGAIQRRELRSFRDILLVPCIHSKNEVIHCGRRENIGYIYGGHGIGKGIRGCQLWPVSAE